MKTSNKILLGLFIAALLMMTGIHVALTQKYKNGGFLVTKPGQYRDSITIRPAKYIKVIGLENVSVIASESFRLEVAKNMPASFKHYVSGDTLIVTGANGISSGKDQVNKVKIYQEISLYLPQVTGIEAENSNLLLIGDGDSARGNQSRIALLRSRLSFKNRFTENETDRYFGDVFVTAKEGSEIELSSDKINFNTLSFELEKSILRDLQTGQIRNLVVKADDSSIVQVSGQNFKKLTAVATAQ
ncbi:hypothetical protein ACX0G7_15320 [Flavitalea antarctica]